MLAALLALPVAGGIVAILELRGPPVLAASRGLDVLPFPGTPDASAASQISFPALKRPELKSVTVTGSRSGAVAGRIEALPAGRGTTFVPSHPFAAGERVTVSADLSSPSAGTASGAPGATRLSFSFVVATPGGASATPAAPSAGSAANASVTAQATQSFRSESLEAPAVTVSADPDTSSGDIFLTAANGSQSGPMILDGNGRLVWFKPVPKGESATNLAVQTYQGEPVLTWWQGKVIAGHGIDGEDIVLGSSYQPVAVVRAGEGYSTDLHEFQITPTGTALLTAYVPVKADLSSIGGTADGTVLDSVVQEVDIKTGTVLWEWHALGHVPLSESNQGRPAAGAPYDYFHINSIQQLANGNLLVSARNTSAIYEISHTTGKVIWQLGGKGTSFKMGPGTTFYYQHDARIQPDGTLTLFDDGASPKQESQSRALQLKLDTSTKVATLLHAYTHTPSDLATSQGSMQVLPNGDLFVGWGAEPDFSEYAPDGKQIFSGSFTLPTQSYRASRQSWDGRPIEPPAVGVSTASGKAVTVYASWNGATDVARWQVLAGASPDKLTPVAQAPRSGFETAIATTTTQRYLEVRALDSSGHVLGVSAPIAR